LPGVARLGNAVAHDGFEFLASEQSFQHARMLTNWRVNL
jgi:bacterioferritin (cytochrome b1)